MAKRADDLLKTGNIYNENLLTNKRYKPTPKTVIIEDNEQKMDEEPSQQVIVSSNDNDKKDNNIPDNKIQDNHIQDNSNDKVDIDNLIYTTSAGKEYHMFKLYKQPQGLMFYIVNDKGLDRRRINLDKIHPNNINFYNYIYGKIKPFKKIKDDVDKEFIIDYVKKNVETPEFRNNVFEYFNS